MIQFIKYDLVFDNLSERDTVLIDVFGTDVNGDILLLSHKHSIIFTNRFIDTGITIANQSGDETAIYESDGKYHVEVHTCEPVLIFNTYSTVQNPYISDYYEKQAQAHLSELEKSNVAIGGIEYQVRTQDVERINQKIGWMQRNSIESVEWIVADNTTKTCTVDDLYKILDAQQARQDAAIQQYTEWRLGDKQTPFEPEL